MRGEIGGKMPARVGWYGVPGVCMVTLVGMGAEFSAASTLECLAMGNAPVSTVGPAAAGGIAMEEGMARAVEDDQDLAGAGVAVSAVAGLGAAGLTWVAVEAAALAVLGATVFPLFALAVLGTVVFPLVVFAVFGVEAVASPDAFTGLGAEVVAVPDAVAEDEAVAVGEAVVAVGVAVELAVVAPVAGEVEVAVVVLFGFFLCDDLWTTGVPSAASVLGAGAVVAPPGADTTVTSPSA